MVPDEVTNNPVPVVKELATTLMPVPAVEAAVVTNKAFEAPVVLALTMLTTLPV